MLSLPNQPPRIFSAPVLRAVAAPGCRKGRPKGASGGNQLSPIRGMMMMEGWGTSLRRVLSFMSRLRSTSLCGVKAPGRVLS